MNEAFLNLSHRIKAIDSKFCKYIDIIYRCGLILYIAYMAMSMTMRCVYDVSILMQRVGTVLLLLVCIYRIVFELFRNIKLAFFSILLVLFSYIFSYFSPNMYTFPFTAMAIVGAIGISADQILLVGIIGNLIMVFNNVLMTLTTGYNSLQARDFFYFGHNSFYVSKINNLSSTDLAAHHFWIIAAYLWVRGYKITWGEIFALSSLNIFIYSLTGSNTSFLCISLVLLIAFCIKIKSALINKKNLADTVIAKTNNKVDSGVFEWFKNAVVFLCRYSFVFFSIIMIILTVAYNNQSKLMNFINVLLHGRLGLGYRGFVEYGVHLVSPGVPSYGMDSSAEGFYNFLDCSYINILIRYGIILLVFYVGLMTLIQLKHKKYVYGVLLLSVCALSCIEEHHLIELPYNFFPLLLFADCEDKHINTVLRKTKINKKYALNIGSTVLCVSFLFASIYLNLPRYYKIKELDRLDDQADKIYQQLQNNIDPLVESGYWCQATDSMNSKEFGEVLEKPSDFKAVTGFDWDETTKDPKLHSFYSVYYDSYMDLSVQNDVLNLIINDEIKQLVGDGSVLIEYDVSAGKVYSVWYAESTGCRFIDGGRTSDRIARLSDNALILEGYSTGEYDE